MQHFIHTKLCKFLEQLDAVEFKQWGKFLASPYHNSNKKLTLLFQLLEKRYPDFQHKQLSLGILNSQLFDKKETDKQLANLFTAAIKSIERFLAMEAFGEDKNLQQLILLRKLRSKNRANAAKKNWDQLWQRLVRKKAKTTEDFLLMYLLQREAYYHPATNHYAFKDEDFQAIIQALDAFYLSSRLKWEVEGHERTMLKQAIETEPLAQQLLSKYVDFLNLPLIKSYADFLKALNESELTKQIELFKENIRLIEKEDQKILFHYYLNLTNRKFYTEDAPHLGEVLAKLYKFAANHNLLINDNKITATSFFNVVETVSSENPHDSFIEPFIKKFQKYLDKTIKKDLINLCLASYYRRLQQHDKCIELLAKSDFKSLHHLLQIQARTLLLKVYFEKYISDRSYFSVLEDYSFAFEKAMRRDKQVSSKIKRSYLNLTILTRKLAKTLNKPNNSKHLNSLKEEINNTILLKSRGWIKKHL